MASSRASSEPLTSPSPTPPPSRKQPIPSAKTVGLDSDSELSELTEEEQDGSRRSGSTQSSSSKTGNHSGRKKRVGGIVPAPMWDWAYKNGTKKGLDDEEIPGTNAQVGPGPDVVDKVEDDVEEEEEEEEEEGEPTNTVREASPADDGGDPVADHESEEEEEEEEEDDRPLQPPSVSQAREGSAELTEVEDVEDVEEEEDNSPSPSEAQDADSDAGAEGEAEAEPEVESEEEEESANEELDDPADPPEEEEEEPVYDEDDKPATNLDDAPVVSAVPAGNSIMAGQQLIKTPSPSPSTSPEPEDSRPLNDAPNADNGDGDVADKDDVEAIPTEQPEIADVDPDVEPNVDPDVEVDADCDAEVEAEEAELDLQPAHRAEALDVLAQIELRYALLREALYVEKMEDLAIEEAMVLQDAHPEMVHLLNELQVRHDRRLELAVKKRRYEDEHVRTLRKVEEEGIWSWWKYERDALQTELYSDTNRKRRRLEREKRTLDRPTPRRAIPPPRPARVLQKPQSVRELVKCASLDIKQIPSSKLKRKRLVPAVNGTTYPKLSVLSRQEIQTDMHQLSVRVRSNYYGTGQMMVSGEMSMAPPIPHGMDGHYPEYGAPLEASVQTPYPPGHPNSHSHPAYPPQPPPESRNIYHHQPLAPAPAPMNGIPRDMQGPNAPIGPPMSPRQYEHGMVNGGPQYGMAGPGQPYTPPPGASSAGAGPSKPPTVNGWAKEHGHGRRVISGNKGEASKFERERQMENGVQDEFGGRMQPPNPISQSQHPHRHPAMHQSLQVHGVPHHHHIVHRHGAHHHHLPGRSSSGPGAPRPPDLDRYPNAPELENGLRRPVAVEQYNLVSKPVSMYKEDPDPGPSYQERVERGERERGRSMLGGPSPMMGQTGPPDRDRPQVTPFVMTPTQAIQASQPRGPGGASPVRRDAWMDERSTYDGPGPDRHSHRMGSPSRHPSSHSIGSPRPRPLASPPLSALPNHIYSPSRIPSKSTNSRPISPIPVLSKAYPSGPGTPGSRLGTPGLAGPGTRPDVPTTNGHHTPVSIYSSGPGLMGPAQPIVPGEHIIPPAKMVAQLGNGS